MDNEKAPLGATQAEPEKSHSQRAQDRQIQNPPQAASGLIKISVGANEKHSTALELCELPFDELATEFSHPHEARAKAGTCFMAATFVGNKRRSSRAVEIGLAIFDLDRGQPRSEIEEAVRARHLRAFIHATYSNATTESVVDAAEFEKFQGAHAGATIGDFLAYEDLRPEIAAGAEVVDETMVAVLGALKPHLVVRHPPIPRYRLSMPLKTFWRRADFADSQTAEAAYKTGMTKLARELGLEFDELCLDLARLYYFPRQRPDGPEYEFVDIAGEPVDLAFDAQVTDASRAVDSIVVDSPEAMRRRDEALGRQIGAQLGVAGATPETKFETKLGDEAFYGLAGKIVRAILPSSEADEAALLFQFLVMFGNCIGRGPYFRVEATEHFANLFVLLVGTSSRARKGTSFGRIETLFKGVAAASSLRLAAEIAKSFNDAVQDEAPRVDNRISRDIAAWVRERIDSGVSSGEGIISRVRDAVRKMERDKTTRQFVETVVDAGEKDKRLLILEEEFFNVLANMQREGNIISRVLRNAWDGRPLGNVTKNSPLRATNAHISLVGHITGEELLRRLDDTSKANGFANRILFARVHRSKLLPFGGQIDAAVERELVVELGEALQRASALGEITRDDDANALWANEYGTLSEGEPGLIGSILGRAEAQVVRLALLYAAVDGVSQIRIEHLRAALAVWTYSDASARHVFGDLVGDPTADTILRALRAQSATGMTRTEISKLFHRHKDAEQIGRALAALEKAKRADMMLRPGTGEGGRPTEVWRAVEV